MRALSVQSIAERLHDRFRVLTGGDRTALPRQQTLRALIDWSYDLLTRTRARCSGGSPFSPASFTLEAAEAVGAGGEIEVASVLDLLARLVEKSLVALDMEGARYRLLETVRQYAQERLEESGESGDARTRHLAFYLALAEEAGPRSSARNRARGSRGSISNGKTCSRHTRGAITYPMARNRGCVSFTRSSLTGQSRAPRRRLRSHDRSAGPRRCPGPKSRALRRLGRCRPIGVLSWPVRAGARLVEESLAIARELGDKRRIEAVLQPLGMACLGRGDVASARTHLTEALALARELGNKRELAAALNAIGQLHRMEGELDAAEPIYGDVVAIARELRDRDIVAIGLLNLAMVSIGRGSTAPARGMLLEVLAISAEIGSKPAEQSVFEVSAGLAASCEDWVSTARFYGIAEAQAARTGLRRDPTDEAFLSPHIAQAREALGAQAFAAEEGAAAGSSVDSALTEVRDWLDRLP